MYYIYISYLDYLLWLVGQLCTRGYITITCVMCVHRALNTEH